MRNGFALLALAALLVVAYAQDSDHGGRRNRTQMMRRPNQEMCFIGNWIHARVERMMARWNQTMAANGGARPNMTGDACDHPDDITAADLTLDWHNVEVRWFFNSTTKQCQPVFASADSKNGYPTVFGCIMSCKANFTEETKTDLFGKDKCEGEGAGDICRGGPPGGERGPGGERRPGGGRREGGDDDKKNGASDGSK